MGEAALWSLLGACSLLIGTEAVFALRPGQRAIGLVMAFGAGAMISAVAYELVLEAVETEEPLRMVLGMALGAGAFFAGDVLISRAGVTQGQGAGGGQHEGSPLAIVLGAALDTIPESLIVGLSIVLAGSVSLSFVAAMFLSNLPESMAATSGLTAAGWPGSRIRLLWLSVVGVSVLAGALGFAIFNARSDATGAFVEGFAAGALLIMLADTMIPEAYQYAGRLAGLFTVAGFVVALAIAGA